MRRFLPYHDGLVDRERELHRQMTAAEPKLWYGFLRGFRWRVLRRRPINASMVDSYGAHLRLVIEVDGGTHFDDTAAVADERRTEALEGFGLQVIHFMNDEVMKNFEGVCEEIARKIEESPPAPLGKMDSWADQENRFR